MVTVLRYPTQPVTMRAYGGSPVMTAKSLEEMSPQEYQEYFGKVQNYFARDNELNALNPKTGSTLAGGSGGVNGGASSSANSSLFGSMGTLTDQAKDLARFRLGLDQEQARFSRGLREEEAQAEFGRTTNLRNIDFQNTYKLDTQQIEGNKSLENIRQTATSDRLQAQLANQKAMQDAGFNQQNLFRAQSAALALRGLR